MLLFILACAKPDLSAVPGELTVVQLHLEGPSIGQSTLIVSPEGTVTLVDVGNDRHDRALRRALERYTGDVAVDFIVLTHMHADHIGGLSDLAQHIGLRGFVVDRGPFDLGEDAANLEEWGEVCELGLPSLALCSGPTPAPCDAPEGPYPADDCPALRGGELLTPDDGGPGWLDLGGARLELLAVNGQVGQTRLPLGYGESADENARSLVSLLRFGEFTLLLPGDLTGGGKDTPDAEAHLIGLGAPEPVDALVLGHHGIRSSTSAAWVDAWMPADGARRDALVGANRGYLDAPAAEVLERVLPRLHGGGVWVTEPGRLAEPGAFCESGDAILRVDAAGDIRRSTATGACGALEDR